MSQAPGLTITVQAPATPVRAGDPFTLVLSARVPVGTTVAFPVGPDSGSIEAVTSAISEVRPFGPDSLVARAVYRLVAWDVGERAVPFGAAVIERDGASERVAVGRVPVTVSSVLPGSGSVEPKPARDPFALPTRWWSDALLVTLALLVGALLVWWAMRRRGAAARPLPVTSRPDPSAALDALAALALEQAGEPSRVLLGAADAVREAVAQAYPRTRVLTTQALGAEALAGVPMARVASLLEDADRARYGRQPVSEARAARALAEARALLVVLRGAGMHDRVGAMR